jgi:hypothetical protein
MHRPILSDMAVRAFFIGGRAANVPHHAVPFDRGALAMAWKTCFKDGCAEARERLEDRIGSLGGAALDRTRGL